MSTNREQPWSDEAPEHGQVVVVTDNPIGRAVATIAEITGAGPERIAVISGPNLSKEIARREPAASVVACADEDVAKRVQDRVHGSMFRPYTSVDVVGCEIGGASPNNFPIAHCSHL